MPSTVLNALDMHTGENSDRKSPQQSVRGSRISICHVSAGDAWAGNEVQASTLLRALSKRPEVSLYAIVLYDGRLAQELRSFGVTVHVVNEQHKSFPRLISGCAQFVKGKNIQILHSHSYKENLVALLLSHSCKVPHLVRTQHGLPPPYSIARNLKHWFVLAADQLAAKYTRARIVGVSSDLGEYWKRHVDPRRVVVVHNGADLERVDSGLLPGEAKTRLGIAGDSFVVGIAARLEGVKRLDLFVATARYLADRIPKSAFVIAGEGRQKEPLQRLILQSGMRDRVALLGERKDVYDVLRAMDVLLICSDHEGIPMVMLEAMALGVAVVSRKVGGIPEVIRDRVTGILVPSDSPEELGRACMLLFERPLWRADLAQVAHDEIHQRYSADKNAEIMVELYRSICR
jgi:glycosyltransferase involved in cell wall biosynthesis